MRIHVDISGQITQRNLDSSLGFRRDDGVTRAVILTSKTKREVMGKYKGQIINLVEKVHCILIYYCIRDHLEGVEEIVVCKDVDFRKVKYYLPSLFKDKPGFQEVKITPRHSESRKSNGHWPALKAHRKRRYANEIITRKMIEDKILEFKS